MTPFTAARYRTFSERTACRLWIRGRFLSPLTGRPHGPQMNGCQRFLNCLTKRNATMNDYDLTSHHDTVSAAPTSPSSIRPSRRIMAAALMCVAIGLSAACGMSSATTTSPSATVSGSGSAGGLGSNARSGPASGGAVGMVDSVSTSSFTMSTSTGQKVTVNEASSTTYMKGSSSTSASAITTGDYVLALGTTSGTTITATQVIVQLTGGGSPPPPAEGGIPFQPGAPTPPNQWRQIPPGHRQGPGTARVGST